MQPTSHIWTIDEHRLRSGELLRGMRLAYTTLGEISDRLKTVFGEYREAA